MTYRLAAEIIVLVHLGFVVFVVLGALLSLRWRRAALVHVPAAIWGVTTEFLGIVCPLTPIEQSLWRLAGESGYSGGFVEHYLVPVLYPNELTRSVQIALGTLAVLMNAALYAWILARRRR